MRLGLTLYASSSALHDAIAMAAAAEHAGFQTVYLTERHFDRPRGFANPFAAAAAISACVQDAWVAVRPEVGIHHPLRLVEQSNLLDVLTHGRSLIVLQDADD